MIKIDKFFGNKKNVTLIYLLVAMGILLMLLGNTPKKMSAQSEFPKGSTRAKEAEMILSEIKGAGTVRVMIFENETEEESLFAGEKSQSSGRESSVLIVADGGADSMVREKIIRAATAALGVDSHKIQVFERKD